MNEEIIIVDNVPCILLEKRVYKKEKSVTSHDNAYYEILYGSQKIIAFTGISGRFIISNFESFDVLEEYYEIEKNTIEYYNFK